MYQINMECGHGGYLLPVGRETAEQMFAVLQDLTRDDTCTECGRPVTLTMEEGWP